MKILLQLLLISLLSIQPLMAWGNTGHRIVGILGTSPQSIDETRVKLRDEYKIKCPGYTSIEELTQKHDIDVIVIATPVDTHWRFLEFLSEKHYHVFCEKPLWWPEDHLDTEDVQIKTENLIEIRIFLLFQESFF